MKIEDIVMHDTHIEVHTVNGVPVYVKRDDLCTASPRLPNLCKVRALVPILLDLKERGIERLAVEAYRAEAATIPSHFVEGGTVVGCAGSGTTLLSVQAEMPDSTSVIGVQVGGALVEPSLQVVLSPYTYYNIARVQPPFPCDMHYDAKAWEWLTQHIKELKQPVLFYNMGG